MNNKNIWIAVVVVAIIAIFGVVSPQSQTVVERTIESNLGVASGPEKFENQQFRSGFTVGGSSTHHATTTTASAYTLTTIEVDKDIPYVEWNAGLNITLTTMASTSAPFSGLAVGESFEQIWYSSTSTAATTITFAAGTGIDLQEDEGGTVIVNGLESARITYLKKTDTDIAVVVEPYQVGD